MKFSVIIPSYLGSYRTAAKNREQKLVRAVNSVLKQTLDDFEVIVISDGCPKTLSIVNTEIDNERVSTVSLPKSKMWAGTPRNAGIELAEGEYITYLDIDDVYGANHLSNISSQLNGYDWVWFNDIRFSTKYKQWYENPCNIIKISEHGTSNICHKRLLPVKWDHDGYAHDYYFVLQLRQNTNFVKISGAEYYVCHIPGGNGAYDL